MTHTFPFIHHPCWSNKRSNLWERIHLPVAIKCNVQCNFCSNQLTSCISIGPGGCQKSMTAKEAISCLENEMQQSTNLKIVAVSGPGEPLYNEATFKTLEMAREIFPHIKICLSTNGILLQQSLDRLLKVGVDSISVSMSALYPETVIQLYHWVQVNSKRVNGEEMGRVVPKHQLAGIRAASDSGINVKVNSILIPGMNEDELLDVASAIEDAGAGLQNIMPLIPRGNMSNQIAPSTNDLINIRKKASVIIPQFSHCKQCRSDVVGIPGCDRVLI